MWLSPPILKSKRFGFVVGCMSFVNKVDRARTFSVFLVTRQFDIAIAVDRFGVRFHRLPRSSPPWKPSTPARSLARWFADTCQLLTESKLTP